MAPDRELEGSKTPTPAVVIDDPRESFTWRERALIAEALAQELLSNPPRREADAIADLARAYREACAVNGGDWQTAQEALFAAIDAAPPTAPDPRDGQIAALREAVNGWRHKRIADDGEPCWCITEHAHRKYGCDAIRAALAQTPEHETARDDAP